MHPVLFSSCFYSVTDYLRLILPSLLLFSNLIHLAFEFLKLVSTIIIVIDRSLLYFEVNIFILLKKKASQNVRMKISILATKFYFLGKTYIILGKRKEKYQLMYAILWCYFISPAS